MTFHQINHQYFYVQFYLQDISSNEPSSLTYLDILCNPIKEHRSPTEPLEYSLHHKKTLTEDTNSVPSSCPSDIPMS